MIYFARVNLTWNEISYSYSVIDYRKTAHYYILTKNLKSVKI